MNLTEEQVIELFEEFLDENYYVGELTEANVLWIYEEEFPQWLEEKMNAMDILGGAATGAATSAVVGFNPIAGAILGGISGAMADYPDAKKAAQKTVAKKSQTSCPPENKTTSEKQEEQQISPKMQAYLNEMSKKGTKSIEHGGDGATTKRDVIIARLQAKEKKSGLSREEAKLLAKLIAAEEKEDSGKKK